MIIKRKVQACTSVEDTVALDLVPNRCEDAKVHIKEAINCLCDVAKDDIQLQQAIANLSVILFDLTDK